jgi:hypothetical protein
MMIMLRNKKAFTLEEAIKLAFVAIILLFTVIIAYRIWSAFTTDRDDGSLRNFEGTLAPKIQELLKSDRKIDYIKTPVNYFIGAAAVVGYNREWDSERDKYVIGLKLEKPASCSDKACLCFFKQDSGLSGKPYKPCIKLDKVAYILKDPDESIKYKTANDEAVANSFYGSSMPEAFTKEYRYFLIDGASLAQKSQPLYIEKYQKPNGDVIIFVAPINDATRDNINKRKAYIDSANQ